MTEHAPILIKRSKTKNKIIYGGSYHKSDFIVSVLAVHFNPLFRMQISVPAASVNSLPLYIIVERERRTLFEHMLHEPRPSFFARLQCLLSNKENEFLLRKKNLGSA